MRYFMRNRPFIFHFKKIHNNKSNYQNIILGQFMIATLPYLHGEQKF